MALHRRSSTLLIAVAIASTASMSRVRLAASAAASMSGGYAAAAAQPAARERQRLVVVIVDTPFLLLPDADREPLRILEAGTVLKLLDEDADWFHIEFQDFHYGRRVGYVQTKDAVAVDVEEQASTAARQGTSTR